MAKTHPTNFCADMVRYAAGLAGAFIVLFGSQDATAGDTNAPQVSAGGGDCKYWSYVLSNWHLTYTTANLSQSTQPATIQFVDNMGGKADSYAIDGALSATLIDPECTFTPDWLQYFGPTVEYHKNNTTQPQDNLQAGLTTYGMFDIKKWTGTINDAELYPQLTLKYVHDNITNANDSFFPQLDLGLAVHDWGCSELLYVFPDTLNSQLGVMWIPDLGVQYQTGKNEQGSKMSGSEARFKASMEIDAYPFTACTNFGKRLKIYAAYTHWEAVGKAGYYSSVPAGYNLFKTGILYYLDDFKNGKPPHISIGCDYSYGENVETGLPRQKTVTISLQAHY